MLWMLLVCCLLPAPAWAADDYYIGASRGADVLAAPQADAAVVGHLERLSEVRVLERQRAWWNIEAADVRGWVPAGAVRKRHQPGRAEKAGNSVLEGLSSLFHRDDPAGRKTAVLGVRGLDEETGAVRGRANVAAVEWMERLTVSDAEIARFIEQGRLNP